MTKLEKTVEALRRCVPAAEFEKAMAEVEATEAKPAAPAPDLEKLIREFLTELGTPDHVKGHRFLVTALLMVVENPDCLDSITKGVYRGVAAIHNTTQSRVERAIRHAVEVTWDRADWSVLNRYFGNTVSREKGKPTNGEFLARLCNIIRQKVKE
jgi:two-component system response regulator (stage 0 sporulation protein A)